MLHVGVSEASQTLGTLLDSVQQGEVVLITRDGKPVARLIPESETTLEAVAARVAARAAEMKIQFDWNELKHDRDADRP